MPNKSRPRILWTVLGISLIAALGVWSLLFSLKDRSVLSLTVFDVGQADAVFIETPDRFQVLVDGGGDAQILQKLGSVMPFWDRTVDLVILTHPHADHVGGLVDVIKRYRVGAVIESNANYGTAEYAEWQKLKKENNIVSHSAVLGMRVGIGRYARVQILSPFGIMSAVSLKNPHDANVTALVSFGASKFLLMGDAEDEIERGILGRGINPRANMLKVGHHGSRTSSSEIFLAAVSPEISVVSAGRNNRYGHPHQEILDRLATFSKQVFRTDRDGDVVISSDGRSVTTATAK